MSDQSLKGKFLVSLPTLKGDYFQHSVTLLLEHNAEGAFGLVINHPTNILLSEIFPELRGSDDRTVVMEGGPVERDRVFFLHSAEKSYESSQQVNEDVILSSSPALIEDLHRQRQPASLIAAVGYAGWAANQLETEILADAWLVAPFDRNILYAGDHNEKPFKAAENMGIDLNLIGPRSGHG